MKKRLRRKKQIGEFFCDVVLVEFCDTNMDKDYLDSLLDYIEENNLQKFGFPNFFYCYPFIDRKDGIVNKDKLIFNKLEEFITKLGGIDININSI